MTRLKDVWWPRKTSLVQARREQEGNHGDDSSEDSRSVPSIQSKRGGKASIKSKARKFYDDSVARWLRRASNHIGNTPSVKSESGSVTTIGSYREDGYEKRRIEESTNHASLDDGRSDLSVLDSTEAGMAPSTCASRHPDEDQIRPSWRSRLKSIGHRRRSSNASHPGMGRRSFPWRRRPNGIGTNGDGQDSVRSPSRNGTELSLDSTQGHNFDTSRSSAGVNGRSSVEDPALEYVRRLSLPDNTGGSVSTVDQPLATSPKNPEEPFYSISTPLLPRHCPINKGAPSLYMDSHGPSHREYSVSLVSGTASPMTGTSTNQPYPLVSSLASSSGSASTSNIRSSCISPSPNQSGPPSISYPESRKKHRDTTKGSRETRRLSRTLGKINRLLKLSSISWGDRLSSGPFSSHRSGRRQEEVHKSAMTRTWIHSDVSHGNRTSLHSEETGETKLHQNRANNHMSPASQFKWSGYRMDNSSSSGRDSKAASSVSPTGGSPTGIGVRGADAKETFPSARADPPYKPYPTSDDRHSIQSTKPNDSRGGGGFTRGVVSNLRGSVSRLIHGTRSLMRRWSKYQREDDESLLSGSSYYSRSVSETASRESRQNEVRTEDRQGPSGTGSVVDSVREESRFTTAQKGKGPQLNNGSYVVTSPVDSQQHGQALQAAPEDYHLLENTEPLETSRRRYYATRVRNGSGSFQTDRSAQEGRRPSEVSRSEITRTRLQKRRKSSIHSVNSASSGGFFGRLRRGKRKSTVPTDYTDRELANHLRPMALQTEYRGATEGDGSLDTQRRFSFETVGPSNLGRSSLEETYDDNPRVLEGPLYPRDGRSKGRTRPFSTDDSDQHGDEVTDDNETESATRDGRTFLTSSRRFIKEMLGPRGIRLSVTDTTKLEPLDPTVFSDYRRVSEESSPPRVEALTVQAIKDGWFTRDRVDARRRSMEESLKPVTLMDFLSSTEGFYGSRTAVTEKDRAARTRARGLRGLVPDPSHQVETFSHSPTSALKKYGASERQIGSAPWISKTSVLFSVPGWRSTMKTSTDPVLDGTMPAGSVPYRDPPRDPYDDWAEVFETENTKSRLEALNC